MPDTRSTRGAGLRAKSARSASPWTREASVFVWALIIVFAVILSLFWL